MWIYALCQVKKDRGDYIYSRSESVNDHLGKLCRSEGANYIDLSVWGKDLLGRDGVLFSHYGAHQVGYKLSSIINSFLG